MNIVICPVCTFRVRINSADIEKANRDYDKYHAYRKLLEVYPDKIYLQNIRAWRFPNGDILPQEQSRLMDDVKEGVETYIGRLHEYHGVYGYEKLTPPKYTSFI